MSEGVRDAIRLWRHRKAFCAAVVGIMALSIGSCTAIFSIVLTVLFAPWPYNDADRLAIIWHTRGNAAGVVGLSPSDHAAYRDSTTTFESVAAITTRGYNLGGAVEPARINCGRATPELPTLLGVGAWRGRWFTQADDQASSRVVVLSHQLWRSRFGSDDGLVGRDIMLDAVPHTVIGILPPSFEFPPPGIQGLTDAACWVPTSFTRAELAMPAFNFIVLAKLKSGVTFDEAARDAAAGAQRIWQSYPAAVQSQVELRARLVQLTEQAVANSRMSLWMFAGSVALLLVIGCANVSNLLLTRLQTRQRELAVRSALGATRAALLKQLLAESILLAVAGGVCGVLLAMGILAAAAALSPGNVPRLDRAQIDWTVMGFTTACAVFAGILGGIAPALRSRDLVTSSGERAPTLGLRRDPLRSGLVILEIAMAVVVLTVAGLLARSLINLNRVALGFDPDGVMMFSVALPASRYQSAEEIDTFARLLVNRLAEIPMVSHVAASSVPPIGRTEAAVVSPTDAATGAPPYRPAAVITVTPDYHATFGIPVRQGRVLEPSDTMLGRPAALVSATMARTFWPDANAVGKTMLRLGDSQPVTIVGVVADVRQAGPDGEPMPTFYTPLAQTRQPIRTITFALRTDARVAQIAPHVRRIVAAADSSLPVFALRSGSELVAASIAPQRFNMFVVSLFAGIALCLAVTGLYAVMAYIVAQSAREFGIRIAVGATMAGIIRLTIRRAIGLIVAGVFLGTAISAGLARLVASLLFGVQPNDPATIGAVAVLLLVVSMAAVLVPALRAGRVDPTTCLRNE